VSILNQTNDGLFNVLIVLIRCLAKQKSMARDKLLALCAPSSAVDDSQKQARQTLNRWIQLGLFHEDDSGGIQLDTSLKNELRGRTGLPAELSPFVRSVVLNATNNEQFWDSENNKSADFTRGVCWALAQNVFTCRCVGHADVQSIEEAQLRDAAAFQNDTRWNGFKSWAVFLGFGWIGRYPSSVFEIDPTIAVREVLPKVFEGSRELRQTVFFNRLAEILPVVDGGEYRTRVEQKIDRSVWRSPKPDQVSTSLSRSLLRLHDHGDLILEERADAEKRSLLGRNARIVRNVSHIVLKGES